MSRYQLKHCCLFVMITLLTYLSMHAYSENGEDVNIERKEISPRGDMVVHIHANEKGNVEVWLETNEMWLKEHPGQNKSTKRFLLQEEDRPPDAIIFSENQERIIINQETGSTSSIMILFHHIGGIEYKKESIDLNKELWNFFSKQYGVDNDEGSGPFSHHYIKGVAFSSNGDALLVSLNGHLGGKENYLEPWYCIYDFEKHKPTLDMNVLNRYSAHLSRDIKVSK